MSTTKTKTALAAPVTPPAKGPRPGLGRRLAAKYGINEDKMLETLKATAFRQRGKDGKPPPEVSGEQMVALLTVAERYDLDPFVKQIYAFPNQAGGIEPIVPIDGWLKIINEHPQFEDMELIYPPTEGGEIFPWIECSIKRKDRSKPTVIREYLAECLRDTGPWKSHPARMLRHKAIIQCGRVAFSLSGISDPDEGERILEASVVATQPAGKPLTQEPKAIAEDRSEEVSYINGSHAALLSERLQGGKLTAAQLCEYFGISALGKLKASDMDAALSWINANAA